MRKVDFFVGGRDYIRGCDMLSVGPWRGDNEVKVKFRGFCKKPGEWIDLEDLREKANFFAVAQSSCGEEGWAFVESGEQMRVLDDRDESHYIERATIFCDKVVSTLNYVNEFWEQVIAMQRVLTERKFNGSRQILASSRFRDLEELSENCEIVVNLKKVKGKRLLYEMHANKKHVGELLLFAS